MKYPKTQYLPWSPKRSLKPERIFNPENLEGKQCVYTEKLDGECTCIHRNGIHARSESGYGRPWQKYMRPYSATWLHDIQDGIYLYGENLEAVHSVVYDTLPSFFFLFNIYDAQTNRWLPWEDIIYYAIILGIPHAPILHYGPLEEREIQPKSVFGEYAEGYVVRNIEPFPTEDFQKNVAKSRYTIEGDEHWTKNWKHATLNPEV